MILKVLKNFPKLLKFQMATKNVRRFSTIPKALQPVLTFLESPENSEKILRLGKKFLKLPEAPKKWRKKFPKLKKIQSFFEP